MAEIGEAKAFYDAHRNVVESWGIEWQPWDSLTPEQRQMWDEHLLVVQTKDREVSSE